MSTFLLRRLFASAVVLALAVCATVLLGGAYRNGLAARDASMEYREPTQLDGSSRNPFRHFADDLLRGRLESAADGRPVLAKIAERLPATLLLVGTALLFIYAFAMPIGIFRARHAGRWLDWLVSFVMALCLAAPAFWIAYLAIFALADRYGMAAIGVGPEGAPWLERAWHILLPASILGLFGVAVLSRRIRDTLRTSLDSEYVFAARAKGLRAGPILYRHALRNALRPIATGFAILLPALLGGAILVETIFQYPGIGSLATEALHAGDYTMLIVLNLVAATLAIAAKFLAAILHAATDPRVRGNSPHLEK